MSFDAIRPFSKASVAPPESLKDFAWPAAFSDERRPIDLEIGCGVGWHPVRYAAANPDRNLIAIEHTREKFEKFSSRVSKHPGLTNLLPVHADAVRWIAHALGGENDGALSIVPKRIDRCFILYPNPEPKAQNKRWFRMPFFHHLRDVLRPGGELTLATNELWYRDEALEAARSVWGLEVVASRELRSNALPHGVPRTHFEKKYLERGQTCFDFTVRKPV